MYFGSYDIGYAIPSLYHVYMDFNEGFTHTRERRRGGRWRGGRWREGEKERGREGERERKREGEKERGREERVRGEVRQRER